MKISAKYLYVIVVVVVVMVVMYVWSSFYATWTVDRLYVLGEENLSPYSFIENGQGKGIDYDILVEAAKRMNINIKIELVPWEIMATYVEKGGCDAGMTFFYFKERERFGIYAYPPLHYSTDVIFVRKGHEFPFASITDLYGKTVGMIRENSISEEFDQAVAKGKITVEVAAQNLQNIKKLAGGRIDCMVSNLDVTLMALKREGLADDLVPLPAPIKEAKGAHLVFSKAGKNITDKDAFVAQFNAVLEDMKADGTFQKIYDTYLK